jgi:four helix bundle protein
MLEDMRAETPPSTGVSDHRSLRVWREAMALAEETYSFTRRFPTHERFGITTQLRRAATSVPANIAEGNGRWHRRESMHHVSIARGSLREVSTLVDLSKRLGYLDNRGAQRSEELIDHVGRMLTRLLKALEAPRR